MPSPRHRWLRLLLPLQLRVMPRCLVHRAGRRPKVTVKQNRSTPNPESRCNVHVPRSNCRRVLLAGTRQAVDEQFRTDQGVVRNFGMLGREQHLASRQYMQLGLCFCPIWPEGEGLCCNWVADLLGLAPAPCQARTAPEAPMTRFHGRSALLAFAMRPWSGGSDDANRASQRCITGVGAHATKQTPCTIADPINWAPNHTLPRSPSLPSRDVDTNRRRRVPKPATSTETLCSRFQASGTDAENKNQTNRLKQPVSIAVVSFIFHT